MSADAYLTLAVYRAEREGLYGKGRLPGVLVEGIVVRLLPRLCVAWERSEWREWLGRVCLGWRWSEG